MYTPNTGSKKTGRIDSLDGLRGVAIIGVVLYHYFNVSRREYHYITLPISDTYAYLFRYGWLGVQLFFCISGFVITFTLHRSSDWADFAIRRFARLWPGMLFCSVCTFCFMAIIKHGFKDSFLNFLPSLTFTDPALSNAVLHRSGISYIDGSYWTLFVEVRFYAMAAFLYFLSQKRFLISVCYTTVLVGALFTISLKYNIVLLRQMLGLLTISYHLPWFSFGVACYYLFYGYETRRAYLLIIIAALLLFIKNWALASQLPDPQSAQGELYGILFVLPLFWLALRCPLISKMLSVRPLTYLGGISYGVYLLHQKIGVQCLLFVGNPLGLSPYTYVINVLAVCTIVTILAQFSFCLIEGPTREFINAYRVRILRKGRAREVLSDLLTSKGADADHDGGDHA